MATTTTEPDSCDPPHSTTSYLCSHKQPHPFNDPRLLSCLHSFCKTCLTDLVNSTNTTIICPTCYEPTLLHNNSGVDGLPYNLRLVHEIEAANIIAKANSSTPITCEGCITDPPPAVAYCVDCEEFICNDCENMHKRKRKLCHHELLHIKNLNISSFLTKTKPSFCPRHPKEPLDLYCQVCHTISCRLCVLTGHVGHTCTDLDQVADSNKQELQQCLLPLTTAISELQSSQEKNTAAQLQLKENTEHVKAAIESAFEALYTALRKRKEKLLQKLHKMSSLKQTRLKKKRDEIVRAAKKLSSSVNVIESTVATYTSSELVSVCDTLKTYLHNKKINHYDVNITQSPSVSSSEIKFLVDPKVLVTEVDQFGKVESTVDPSSSVIIGSQISRAIVGKKHTIILETKDREGGRCCEGEEKVKVTLIDKDKSDHSINGTVLDKGTGQYELSFTPPSPGTYEVHVTIDNEHIKNSPFTVYARPYRDYRQLKEPVTVFETDKSSQKPHCIFVSSDGTIYVSCYTAVYKYKKDGSLIARIGIDEGTVKFKPDNWGVAVKGDVLYVANNGVNSIIKLTTTGKLTGQFGHFNEAWGLSIDKEGKSFVTDVNGVHIFNSDETILRTIKCGTVVKGLALDPSGNIHVTCRNEGYVAVYSQTGKYLRCYGEGQLKSPYGITVDEEGYSLVSERIHDGQLKIFSPEGKLIHCVGDLQYSAGVCINNDSNIFVTSENDRKVYMF